MLRSALISTRLMREVAKATIFRGKRSLQVSNKRLGGHSHGEHAPQKPLGPYELPHHSTYPSQQHLFGIDPSVPYKYEGWEHITWATYIIMFGLFISANWDMKKDDTFKVRYYS